MKDVKGFLENAANDSFVLSSDKILKGFRQSEDLVSHLFRKQPGAFVGFEARLGGAS